MVAGLRGRKPAATGEDNFTEEETTMFGNDLLKANKALVAGDCKNALKHYARAAKAAPWKSMVAAAS